MVFLYPRGFIPVTLFLSFKDNKKATGKLRGLLRNKINMKEENLVDYKLFFSHSRTASFKVMTWLILTNAYSNIFYKFYTNFDDFFRRFRAK